jgi:hypothetical protein
MKKSNLGGKIWVSTVLQAGWLTYCDNTQRTYSAIVDWRLLTKTLNALWCKSQVLERPYLPCQLHQPESKPLGRSKTTHLYDPKEQYCQQCAVANLGLLDQNFSENSVCLFLVAENALAFFSRCISYLQAFTDGLQSSTHGVVECLRRHVWEPFSSPD